MLYLLKFLYALISPLGIWVVLLLIFTYISFDKSYKLSIFCGAMALLIYITSIPIIADGLVRSMEAQYQPPSEINGDVIIMLAGGSTADTPSIAGLGHPSGETAGRMITAAALHQRYHLPIIIAGGQVNDGSGVESEIARQSLVAIGISKEDIIIENKSRSTKENAMYVKEIVDANKFSSPVLVLAYICPVLFNILTTKTLRLSPTQQPI
jgi:uncharacterized SAM-binding protein YcdF (DUF218 family)